jgi:nitrate/TMAO reductase-like tetraheme cytochrome c subunit
MRLLLVVASIVVVGVLMLGVGVVGSALAMENQDSFCASCHTEPEVTYYQQSLEPSAATLAAFHASKQTACIDCHSGGGIFGRAKGLMQGADDLMMYYGGNYRRPAATTNPLSDDSCVKCHEDVLAGRRGARRVMDGHYHAFLSRWQAADPNAAHCITCHTSHTQGAAGVRYMTANQVSETCDQCHAVIGEGETE